MPPELPEPALGINFARDGMQEKDWLALVAVHSDAWLLSVAFYFGARFGFDKADRYVHCCFFGQILQKQLCCLLPSFSVCIQSSFDECLIKKRNNLPLMNLFLQFIFYIYLLWTYSLPGAGYSVK